MKTLIFIKYNRERAPRFRTATAIYEENGTRFVEKTALCEDCQPHIDAFLSYEKTMRSLYTDISILPVEKQGDVARFPYVSGEPFSTKLEVELFSETLTKERVISCLQSGLSRIERYRDEQKTSFSATDACQAIFGDIAYSGEAVKIANLDLIFDNFIETDDGLTLLDYEWSFDFPVPTAYIRFRTVYYFWVKHHSILSGVLTEEEYLSGFGISPENAVLWKTVEERFQQYVYGKDRCYQVATKMEAPIYDINTLLRYVDDVGGLLDSVQRENLALHMALHPSHYPGYVLQKLREKRK